MIKETKIFVLKEGHRYAIDARNYFDEVDHTLEETISLYPDRTIMLTWKEDDDRMLISTTLLSASDTSRLANMTADRVLDKIRGVFLNS